MPTPAYAASDAASHLKPFTIERRGVGPRDVGIAIDYCGVCHSDLHMARNDWGFSQYPLVPGHEIIGTVAEVGSEIDDFRTGDRVGVGCLVGSCGGCGACRKDLEQYCPSMVMTYSSPTDDPGGLTFGGYSKAIVVDRHFVVRVPENLDPAGAAPLLCAGITTYSPLAHWNIGRGSTVGVIGLGGLGHMGIKLAHAMGARTVMITRSPDKAEDAKSLGADDVLLSTDPGAMNRWAGEFDFLLNTIPVKHDVNPYLPLLKVDGVMCIVGLIGQYEQLETGPLVMGRRTLAGSLIGGLKETQEMLDFCGRHNIVSDIERIAMADINKAYDRLLKSEVKYRFVIDMATL
ncbi:MAG: NAD(P)-dependent alcohol dehydrogenase [Phycisphaerales bacterium]